MKSLAQEARHQRCTMCNRIAETGEQTDLGWVGPECQRKVAALPDLLESLNINTGLTVRVRAERVGYATVEYGYPYDALRRRLATAGLTLERVGRIDWTVERPIATFRVSVDRVRKFNAAIKPFSQVRKEFADRLKAGSAAKNDGHWSMP